MNKQVSWGVFVPVLAVVFFILLITWPVQNAGNGDIQIATHKKENPSKSTIGRKSVGLALGSGGARGLSHIGVIKALERNNIPIDYIAGSSSGALVGGMYAATFNVEYLEEIAKSTSWLNIIQLIDPRFRSGIIAGNKLTSFIEEHAGDTTFNELQIPLTVVATDLKTGESVQIREGKISDAIRASISLPFVFNPVKRGDRLLLDGGLSEPVPVRAVREMGADIVIAVNLDSQSLDISLDDENPLAYKTTLRSLDILRYHLAKENIESADVVIVPKTGKVLWHEFVGNGDLIKAGEEAVELQIEEIRALLIE